MIRRSWLSSPVVVVNSMKRVFIRHTATAPEPDHLEESKPGGKKKYKKSQSPSEDKPRSTTPSPTQLKILSYIKENSKVKPAVAKLLSKQFLRQNKTVPTSVCLVNDSVAAQIEALIKSEQPCVTSAVLELHSGMGILTDRLINGVGFKHVNCFEDNAKLGEVLKSSFQDKVSVIDCSLDDLPRLYHLDKHDGGERIHNILSQIETGSQNGVGKDKPNLYIVGVLPHISPVNFLLRCYATQRVLFDEHVPWSDITFFVALGSKVDLICHANPSSGLVAYRATSVLFQTFFKTKKIGTVQRKAFIPWETPEKILTGIHSRKLKVENSDLMNVFKIEINKELLQKIPKEELFTFWYFVRQCLYARKNRIIPELEKWMPGCGMRLIKQGYDIFSQFGLIESKDILQLYLEFVSWPEFQNSSFLNAVEKYQTRLEISEEEEE